MSDIDLSTVDLFANLSEEDLARLTGSLSEQKLDPGEFLFHEGDVGDAAYVLTDGDVEIIKDTGGSGTRLAILGPGALVGEMALLAGEPRNASCRAITLVMLVVIPKATFDEVIETSPTALHSLFSVFLTRWREQESRLRQSERMAQLGVLTAGLAHEMNNPAAAIVRGADQLRQHLADYGSAMQQIPSDAVVPSPETNMPVMSSLERADLEERMEEALESAGFDKVWELVPPLVSAGFTQSDLLSGDQRVTPELLQATATRAELTALLREVSEGATRLSELVGALKSYSFLDQAPVQDVDVAQGIEDTLLILRSKIQGIDVVRHYADTVPRITALGSQLNQVWTNLIDNAADAIVSAGMTGGVITISTDFLDGCVVVTVENDGPAIPQEIQDRIFEAFFTTKPPGSGTGLGLDTAYNIVVVQHGGSLEVHSDETATRFTVVLPTSPEVAIG
ncbi:MAG: cyclic nucleotide-binding domain-containing protein [Actinomycetia bacterium]|nr:cyclic nucleotide-binding domain-containing protein [Actinomycetes bacterium]